MRAPAPVMNSGNQLMNIDQAAAYLGETPLRLRTNWKRWELPGVKVGRSVKFRVRDLDSYVESHKAGR